MHVLNKRNRRVVTGLMVMVLGSCDQPEDLPLLQRPPAPSEPESAKHLAELLEVAERQEIEARPGDETVEDAATITIKRIDRIPRQLLYRIGFQATEVHGRPLPDCLGEPALIVHSPSKFFGIFGLVGPNAAVGERFEMVASRYPGEEVARIYIGRDGKYRRYESNPSP